MSKSKEAVWPGILFVASAINVIGGGIAIGIGEAAKNPFFYCAFTTSCLYATANAVKLVQICKGDRAAIAPTPLQEVVVLPIGENPLVRSPGFVDLVEASRVNNERVV